jgi:hypothetical protein
MNLCTSCNFFCSNCAVVFVSIHFLRFVLKTSCVSDFVLLRSTHERPLNGSLWVFMKNAVWNYFVEKLMVFHGCVVVRALDCNRHGSSGWWSIWESCGRRECRQ